MIRPNTRARGYDRDWERLRRWHLNQEPLCRYCKEAGRVTPGSVVDHIVPIREAPERRLDPSNLQTLCAGKGTPQCHNTIKAAEERGAGRRGCDADGMPIDPTHHWQGDD